MSVSNYTALTGDVPVSGLADDSTSVTTNPNDAASLENEFISLMVAQIQNQDPLNPADGTEYVSQLAQFSQVESSENMVSLMENNLTIMDNLQVLSTAALVGQDVTIRNNEFTVDGSDDQQVAGEIALSAPSSQVNLIIEDYYGNTQAVTLGAQSAGVVDFELDLADLNLAKGDYSLSVELSNGQNYQPEILLRGQVESLNIPADGGASMVSIRGLGSVPFYDIAQFAGHS